MFRRVLNVSRGKRFYPSPMDKTKIFGIGATGAGLGTISGLGGGIIMVPLMSEFLKQERLHSTAMSLFGVCVNAIVASTSFLLMGLPIDVTSAGIIGGCAAISSIFGAKMGKKVPQSQLPLYFAMLALFVGIFVPIYGYLKKSQVRKDIDNKYLIHAAAGIIGGFLSGLLGVGGAIFYVPVLLSTTDMPQVKIVGTAIACTLLPSIFGVITHHRLGNLKIKKALFLACGCIVGGIIGSRLASKAPEDLLRNIFSVMVLLVAFKQFRIYRSLKIGIFEKLKQSTIQ